MNIFGNVFHCNFYTLSSSAISVLSECSVVLLSSSQTDLGRWDNLCTQTSSTFLLLLIKWNYDTHVLYQKGPVQLHDSSLFCTTSQLTLTGASLSFPWEQMSHCSWVLSFSSCSLKIKLGGLLSPMQKSETMNGF